MSRLMRPFSLLFLLAALLLLPACETTFEVEPPETEPQLVINGLFEADSLWTVHVSQLVPTRRDYDGRNVENATVEILQDGQVIDTLRPFYNDRSGELEGYRSDEARPATG